MSSLALLSSGSRPRLGPRLLVPLGLCYGLLVPQAGCDCAGVKADTKTAAQPSGSATLRPERGANRPATNAPDEANAANAPHASATHPAGAAVLAAAALRNTPLSGRVRGLYLGRPARHGNLTLYPVSADLSGLARRVLTVDAAFARHKLEVREEGSGSVPFIRVQKPRSDEVFVMTGEMFVGARQDRISKHDVLLPQRAGTFRLPVYCVEQGRWSGSHQFRTGKVLSTRSLRKSAAKKGSQTEVWGKVAAKTGNLRARTPTQTMAASYRSRIYRQKSPAFLRALGRFAVQRSAAVGVLVVINDTVASLDVFANHDLFERLYPKLLKAFVLDAVDPRFRPSDFAGARPREFLAALSRVKYRRTRTPGLGREYLLASKDVSGTLLVADQRLVHLALFPEREGQPTARRLDSVRRTAPRVQPAPANPPGAKSPRQTSKSPQKPRPKRRLK